MKTENKTIMITINIERQMLLKSLNQLKTPIRHITTRKNKEYIQCEITVTDNKITLAIPGGIIDVPCSVYGSAKISIPLLYFCRIIEDLKRQRNIKISVEENQLIVGSSTIPVETTFFEDDSILRTIKLPLNYTELDLLRLVRSNKYTFEELYFNRLTVKVDIAEKHLQRNIEYVYQVLKHYGVIKKEIEDLVENRI